MGGFLAFIAFLLGLVALWFLVKTVVDPIFDRYVMWLVRRQKQRKAEQ